MTEGKGELFHVNMLKAFRMRKQNGKIKLLQVVMEEDSAMNNSGMKILGEEPTCTFGEQLDEVKRNQLLTLLGKYKVYSARSQGGRTCRGNIT